MKKLIILLLPIYCNAQFTHQDSASIKQFVFVSVNNKIGLVTNDPEIYHSVVHGDSAFIEAQKPIEFNKALQRRKPIAIIKAKCK